MNAQPGCDRLLSFALPCDRTSDTPAIAGEQRASKARTDTLRQAWRERADAEQTGAVRWETTAKAASETVEQLRHELREWETWAEGVEEASEEAVAASSAAGSSTEPVTWRRRTLRTDGRTRTHRRVVLEGPPQPYADPRTAAAAAAAKRRVGPHPPRMPPPPGWRDQ